MTLLMAAGLICQAEASANLTVDVHCRGMDIGKITVTVDNTGADGHPLIEALFTPPIPFTVQGIAASCGEDHLNWLNKVDEHNVGLPGLPERFLDPPAGGLPGFTVNDRLPYYYDEGDVPGGSPSFNIIAHTFPGVLEFYDSPLGPDGTFIAFSTVLASVNADGSLHDVYEGFRWRYDDPLGPEPPSIVIITPIFGPDNAFKREIAELIIAGGFDLRNPIPEPPSVISLTMGCLGGVALIKLRRRSLTTLARVSVPAGRRSVGMPERGGNRDDTS